MTRPPNVPRQIPWRLPSWRLLAFCAFLAISCLALLARLVELQLVDGDRYRVAAQANQIRLIPVAAPRGMIVDRHGAVIARSRPSFVVGLIPSEVTDVSHELTILANVLDIDARRLWYRLLHHRGVTYPNFESVASSEPYGPVILATDLPVAAVARLSEVLDRSSRASTSKRSRSAITRRDRQARI